MTLVEQKGREWLSSASPEAVAEALRAGQLAEVMGAPAPIDAVDTASAKRIAAVNAELIADGTMRAPAPQPNPGQGVDSGPGPSGDWRSQQIEQLKQSSPDEVVAAFKRGDFADLLNPRNH